MTDHKQNTTIDITGDYNSGKTQVAKIIKQALDNYGISVTVNSNENSYLEYEQFKQSNLNAACRKISQTTHVTVMDCNNHPTPLVPTVGDESGDNGPVQTDDTGSDARQVSSRTQVKTEDNGLESSIDESILLCPHTHVRRYSDMFPLRIPEQETTSQIPIIRYTVNVPEFMHPCSVDDVRVDGIYSVLARVGGNKVRLLVPNGELRRIDVSDTSYFVTKQNEIDEECEVGFSYDCSSGLLTAYVKNVGKSIELLGVCLYGDSSRRGCFNSFINCQDKE